MRVGVFGGSFNPPHAGHLLVARQACEALALDRLLWVPANRSPLKDGRGDVAGHHRLAMAALMAQASPLFRASDLELRRPAPSFTVDTLRVLRSQHPDWTIFLIIGQDSWESFDRWKEGDAIREMAQLCVYPRGAPGAESNVTWLPAPLIDVSSTDIRARLASGRPVAGLISDDVQDYIRKHNLYATPSPDA